RSLATKKTGLEAVSSAGSLATKQSSHGHQYTVDCRHIAGMAMMTAFLNTNDTTIQPEREHTVHGVTSVVSCFEMLRNSPIHLSPHHMPAPPPGAFTTKMRRGGGALTVIRGYFRPEKAPRGVYSQHYGIIQITSTLLGRRELDNVIVFLAVGKTLDQLALQLCMLRIEQVLLRVGCRPRPDRREVRVWGVVLGVVQTSAACPVDVLLEHANAVEGVEH
ncbi:unnamed protein product, partial [Pylaiella littoralis]